MLCSHDLATTGADAAAIEAIETFRDRLLRMEGGTDEVLLAAAKAPECPLLQIYAAIFWLYAGTRAGNAEATPWIRRAEKTIANGTEREKCMLEVCHRWQANDPESAIDLLEEITRLHPRDTVAAKASEFNYYKTGQHFQARRFLRQMKRLINVNDADPDVQAMCGFAHELSGHYDQARRHAEKAVELRFATPWAHHALSHIALITDDVDRGLREQKEFLPTWDNPGPSIHGHNGWHLALLRLRAGDRDGCLELYDSLVWGHLTTSVGQQTDAISLLWRLEIHGESIAPERWEAIARACAPTADEALSPFTAAHHAYAFTRAQQTECLEKLRAAVTEALSQGTLARRRVWREAGLPAVEGSIAAARQDSASVVEALLPAIHEIPRVGGSDAQDDLWREALLHALTKLGRSADRHKILALFPGTRALP